MWVLSGLLAFLTAQHPDVSYRLEQCAGVVFRETPYSDLRCAHELPPSAVGEQKHFRFAYDSYGRLIEVSFRQNDELRDYRGRFVRAPMTRISYNAGAEIRRYFDQYGNRTLVSGDVYEMRFQIAEDGTRESAQFSGVQNEPVEDHFGIARYEWTVDEHGVVTEHRYNLTGDLVRNRPGFGYLVTRFYYDADGLLRRMENWGHAGMEPTPDPSGTVATEIRYNQRSQFRAWRNVGMDGNARRGMSDIAEILYQPGRYFSEAQAEFLDANGEAQTTRWGAHRVLFDFDRFGNPIRRRFYDTNGELVDVDFGVAETRYVWSGDGTHRLQESYFNGAGEPIERSDSGVHGYRSVIDAQNRIVEVRSIDVHGATVVDQGSGYAIQRITFDNEGRLLRREYLDAEDQPTNHAEWHFFSVDYRYIGPDLFDVVYRNARGLSVDVRWNPAH